MEEKQKYFLNTKSKWKIIPGHWEPCQNADICSDVHLGIFSSRKTRTKQWVQIACLQVAKKNFCWAMKNIKERKKETWEKTIAVRSMRDDQNLGGEAGLAEEDRRREPGILKSKKWWNLIKASACGWVTMRRMSEMTSSITDPGHGMLWEEAGSLEFLLKKNTL